MTYKPLRWLAANLGTMLVALLLAVIVWVIAVISADPMSRIHSGPPLWITLPG